MGILQALRDWFPSLSLLFPRFIHVRVMPELSFFPQITCHYTDTSHQLMDMWVVTMRWRLRVILLWTLVYKFLCGRVFISLG